jgi:hypothetical protein
LFKQQTHRLKLWDAHLLHERVEQDNTLVAEEAVEVGVAVAGALGAVHNKEFGEWKLQACCESVDGILKRVKKKKKIFCCWSKTII